MQTRQELKDLLHQIDHKSYGSYKVLKGIYQMGNWQLSIDQVQGDPFATPSRVRLAASNQKNFPKEYYTQKHRKIALEDWILRKLQKNLYQMDLNTKGSGKSGLVSACRVGQEVLERIAIKVDEKSVQARLEIGFPAFGRTIAARELEKILFGFLDQLVEKTLFYAKYSAKEIKEVIDLADDQLAIRNALADNNLCAFIADGSILPRESGISQKPMKTAIPFLAPKEQAVTLELPHQGKIRGLGIKRGVTVIVGGGYHGKSTLLKAIELGIYDHILGDGREYVITDDSAVKLRAEEGRCIHDTDISLFINHLPNKTDTVHFSTENASGSTSQAANTVEAIAADSKLFLIDEDTSATNFMVRDSLMAALVSEEKEPITPFLQCVRSLFTDYGISSIIVVGSSGAFLSVADCVLQMDNYETKEVSQKAKSLVKPMEKNKTVKIAKILNAKACKQSIEKTRIHGWDSLSLDKSEIDLRYLEQLVDEGQSAALGYLMLYALNQLADEKKTAIDLAKEVMILIEKNGFETLVPHHYPSGSPVLPRVQELAAALERYRYLTKKVQGRKPLKAVAKGNKWHKIEKAVDR